MNGQQSAPADEVADVVARVERLGEDVVAVDDVDVRDGDVAADGVAAPWEREGKTKG